ncbi:hypothetical protein [Streptomyces radicis]|uniref:Lipoprotein n=1 Tax=Streptomyces radicis TaxID=1750517 RepID=A0A3A9WML0_9ACTN|nr:hypothetical protein [Streptomyces radicis]RKN08976.1 hypothetical protein D7319_13655 [Streptomyces radicis]RKN22833.1 hypothetical protein D7318_14900 [Streptomyces radicis]
MAPSSGSRTRLNRALAALLAATFLTVTAAACGDGNGRRSGRDGGSGGHSDDDYDDDDYDDDFNGTSGGGTSSGGTGSTPTVDPVQRAALEEAVAAYVLASFVPAPDDAAGLLSQRCRDFLDLHAFTVELRGAVDEHGAGLTARDIRPVITGHTATVSYGVADIPALAVEGEPWIRENGEWHNDGC